MLFNSLSFGVFFLLVIGLHYSPLPWAVKKFNLLVCSYFFYAAWNPPFTLLLLLSTLVDWTVAKQMVRSRSLFARRAYLVVSLAANLGILAYFKYGQFLVENAEFLLGRYIYPVHSPAADIILPVGISFYTFQTLSYTIDVYRGALKPARSLLDFGLYVAFFPQLVAGPIVRASDFLPQCRSLRAASLAQFCWGLQLLALGLFQKVWLADNLFAPVAEGLFSRVDVQPDFISAWSGTLAFAGQIFCDFAGYSTSAIGVAMCLGFVLPDNFRFPYAAIGFSDFWRRWHISLSSWLRDYLYIPLGGNRGGRLFTHRNLLLTMLLGGLWHGASWTFICWGGLHGIFLVGERAIRRTALGQLAVWRTSSGRIVLAMLTFACICYTWVLFRADSFAQAGRIVAAMSGIHGNAGERLLSGTRIVTGVSLCGLLVAVHGLMRNATLESIAVRAPRVLWALWMGGIVVALLVSAGDGQAFIYFQF